MVSVAIEACEPRQLLVVPTLTPGMTPAQIAAAWATASAQATQEVTNAVNNLNTTATGMQTQFDNIGSTLTSQQAASQAALQAADTATFAGMDAQIVVINATYDSVVGPENASNAADLQIYLSTFNTGVSTASVSFNTTDAADRAALESAEQGVESNYEGDVANLTATLNGATAAEQATLDGARSTALGQYNTDVATANGVLNAAITAAETGLASALASAGATRDTNITGFDSAFNSSVATAAAARTFAVSPYPNVAYDAGLADGDSSFQSTVQSAWDQYHLAVMNAHSDYQDDLDDADSNYNDSVTNAQTWLSGQMTINHATYETDKTNARDNYTSSLVGPQATRNANVTLIESNFRDDKQNALDAKQVLDTQAWTDYSNARGVAEGIRDGAITSASDTYSLYQQSRTDTFNGAVQTRTDTYQGVRDGLFTTFTTDIHTSQQNYDDSTKTNKDNYVLAKHGAITTRDTAITNAQADYATKINGLRNDRNRDADIFWASAMSVMMANMMNGGGGTINNTPLLAIQQKYEIEVAGAGVFLADALGGAKVQYNSTERGAATALATSNANDSETLAVTQGTHVLNYATGLANAQEPFQQDIANMTAVFQIDLETKFVAMMKNVAGANWGFAYGDAAAAWQRTIDLSVSEWSYQYDLAVAQETHDKGLTNEAYNYAVIESGVNETLQNSLAAADATVSNSDAVDAETAANMVHAAGATWIRDQYQAYVDYVNAVATPYMTMVSAIANARAVAIVNALGGGADVIIVANAWRDYEVAVGNAEVFRAISVAGEWQSYGNIEASAWQSAEDQKAAAYTVNTGSMATAFTTRVSSDAAAQHTYEDNVALAEKTFADAEATKFRTKTEQDADAEKAYAQAWASDAQTYDQDVADAVHAYDLSYWSRHLTNFTIDTNAERDRIKSEQTELKNTLIAKATHEYNQVVTNSADRKTAAINAAAQDQQGAVTLAEKDRSMAVRAAYDARDQVLARALVTFTAAAYSRLEVAGIGTTLAQGLNWVWNSFPDLDTSVNFVTGWSDSLTGGGSAWVRQALGIDGGVQYGSGAYRGGQIVGMVHGFVIGGAAGNLAHVGRAYTAARVITTTASACGAITAANNIKNGNGTVWDALALAPGAGYVAGRMTGGLGIFRCFVGETPVVIAEANNVAMAAAGIVEGERQAGFETSLMVLAGMTITAGWLGKEALDERQRRGLQKPRRDVVREYDLDDPHRCEMVCDVTELVAASELSAKEFDMLCDDLLSGDVEPCDIRGSRVSQSTSALTTSTTLSTREPRMPQAQQRPSRHVSMLGLAWMWACLLIGGGLLWSGLSGTSSPAQPLQASMMRVPTTPTTKFITKPIQDLRVGERVLAHNPEVSDSERAEAIEPDPATWRQVSLVMQKPDGSDLRIEMLRPVDWLADQAVALIDLQTPGWFARDGLLLDEARWEAAIVGRTIELNLPEMGAAGPAKVVAVQPCPQLERNSGDNRQLVTATFQHSSGDVLDLHIHGESEPIGSTANHPFWSEDRQAFIPAGELLPGETLRRADNTLTQLTRITPRRGPPVAVYNLEVNAEHVYFVGQDGVLVHNTYPHGNSLLSSASNHGYAIFDAVTGKVLKFGISSQRIAGNGQSYRVTSQLRQMGARGIDAFGEVLEHFPNRAAAVGWEKDAVRAFKNQIGDLGEQLLPR